MALCVALGWASTRVSDTFDPDLGVKNPWPSSAWLRSAMQYVDGGRASIPRSGACEDASIAALCLLSGHIQGLNKNGVGNEGGDCLRVVAGHGERRSLNSGGQAKTTSP